jgi:hypothetical protein
MYRGAGKWASQCQHRTSPLSPGTGAPPRSSAWCAPRPNSFICCFFPDATRPCSFRPQHFSRRHRPAYCRAPTSVCASSLMPFSCPRARAPPWRGRACLPSAAANTPPTPTSLQVLLPRFAASTSSLSYCFHVVDRCWCSSHVEVVLMPKSKMGFWLLTCMLCSFAELLKTWSRPDMHGWTVERQPGTVGWQPAAES